MFSDYLYLSSRTLPDPQTLFSHTDYSVTLDALTELREAFLSPLPLYRRVSPFGLFPCFRLTVARIFVFSEEDTPLPLRIRIYVHSGLVAKQCAVLFLFGNPKWTGQAQGTVDYCFIKTGYSFNKTAARLFLFVLVIISNIHL